MKPTTKTEVTVPSVTPINLLGETKAVSEAPGGLRSSAKQLLIYAGDNSGANAATIFIGDDTVTTGNGFPVLGGTTFGFGDENASNKGYHLHLIYVVSAAGGEKLRVLAIDNVGNA